MLTLKSLPGSCGILLTGLLLSASASATLIDPTTWDTCKGQAQCTIGNATLDAAPDGRTFQEKTVDGQKGLGISGGRTSGEIDLDETFSISYLVDEVIDLLRIVFIFNGPEFNDVAEIAEVTINGSEVFTLSVSPTTDNLASWSGSGSVSSCGDTTGSGSGCFDIFNPFGNTAVSSMSLTALVGADPLLGDGTNESDFSVGAISGVAVPEPGTLSLLGVGLVGLGLLRRRQRRL